MSHGKEDDLIKWTRELTRSFNEWDHIYEHGCSDPFHADGVNLNLVRNHIIYEKREIDRILKEEQENTLFSTPYPDIYFRGTPSEVPYSYMAREEEIRARAQEQMSLYLQNPDFCYIRDHCESAFPNGETRATKAAGIYPPKFFGIRKYQMAIDRDDLVSMRSYFSPSYEKQSEIWAEQAKELRAFVESDHSHDDNTPAEDNYYEDDINDTYEEPLDAVKQECKRKTSLDEQIKSAHTRAVENQDSLEREDQLSLF